MPALPPTMEAPPPTMDAPSLQVDASDLIEEWQKFRYKAQEDFKLISDEMCQKLCAHMVEERSILLKELQNAVNREARLRKTATVGPQDAWSEEDYKSDDLPTRVSVLQASHDGHGWLGHHRRGFIAQREVKQIELLDREEEQWRADIPTCARSSILELHKSVAYDAEETTAGNLLGTHRFSARKKPESLDSGRDITDTHLVHRDISNMDYSRSRTNSTDMIEKSRISDFYYHHNGQIENKPPQKQPGAKLLIHRRLTLRERVKRFVCSFEFDVAMGLSILCNAMLIGVQTDYNVKHGPDLEPTAFRVFNIGFCMIFATELFLRLVAHRLRFFWMPGWRWNAFDFLVVILQVCEEIMETLRSVTTTVNMNLSFVRVLRIFRLIRIVRLVRIIRMIGELRALIASILASLRALLWTVVLIALMLYVVGVWVTQMVADEIKDNKNTGLERYFNTLIRTIVTMFQCITGGINWDQAMRPAVDHISPFMGIVFCAFIAFSVLAILNVVTGVFVESAIEMASQDKDQVTVNTLNEFFKNAAGSGGTMSWDDFESNLDTVEMQDYFRLIDIDMSEAFGIFRLLDLTGCGEISKDEFLSGCVRLRGSAKALDMALLTHEVRRLDMWLSHITRLLQHSHSRPRTPTKTDVPSPPTVPVVAPTLNLDTPVEDFETAEVDMEEV